MAVMQTRGDLFLDVFLLKGSGANGWGFMKSRWFFFFDRQNKLGGDTEGVLGFEHNHDKIVYYRIFNRNK